MGQKNTAQKLFEQFKSKPSNRARDQIWALYHDPNFTDADVDINIEDTDDSEISNFVRGSKESLDYKQSKAFLSDLYEFLKEIDQKRERSFRVWENKDKILKEWLIAYGNCQTQPEIIQNNNELNDDQKELITEEGWELVDSTQKNAPVYINPDTYRITKKDFYYALQQIQVENKIEKYHYASFLEENWDLVEVDEKVSEHAVDELMFNQIDNLLKNGDYAFKKGQHRIAHKKYQLALSVIEGYLFDAPTSSSPTFNETFSLLKKRLFITKRKLEQNLYAEEELIAKTSGTMKKNSQNLDALPTRALYFVIKHLPDHSKSCLKSSSRFFQNAVYCIIPLLRSPDSNVNWKNLGICLQTSEKFSILNYLFPEIKMQIFSQLSFNDRLQIRAVSKGLKDIVDNMLKAEFENMHLQNFTSLQSEIVTIGEGSYSERAVQITGDIGLGMLQVGGEMAKGAGGVGSTGVFALIYLGVILGIVAVGGIMYLESAVGGPISGSIGKAVELIEVGLVQNEKLSDASFCHRCDRQISFLDKKWACRACRATFCNGCKYNDLVILVAQKKTSFNVKLCDKCYKLIDAQYDRQKVGALEK